MDIDVIPNNMEKYIIGFHAWKTFGFYRQSSVHEFKS